MPGTDNTADRTEATSAEDSGIHTDISEYLSAVFGDAEGIAHSVGRRAGYFTARGGYSFKPIKGHFNARWIPLTRAWPAEADQLAADLAVSVDTYDIYVCPYLMTGDERTPGGAVALSKVHADIDGECPLDKVADLGGWAVSTGSPGHAHVYVDLAAPVPLHHHTALCRALGAHLGDADAKIMPNDVLRPPGTLNHKGRARGGESAPVEWLIRPAGVRWDGAELADRLGITLPDAPPPGSTRTKTTKGKGATATATPRPDDADDDPGPFDLSAYADVVAALDYVTDDRSRDTNRVVSAVYDAGLTLPHARWAVDQRADLAERLAARHDDDVLTLWLKTDADRRRFIADGAEDDDSDGTEDNGSMPGQARFTDAGLAEIIADKALRGRFLKARGVGWLQWTGTYWRECGDGPPTEAVRRFVMGRLRLFARKLAAAPRR